MTTRKKGPSTSTRKPSVRRGSKGSSETNNSKLGLFDHVKHIRGVQDPNYFKNLSEENRKSFNPFMILRALAMDDDILGVMAVLYRYFDKIPPEQFYQLLIALVPKDSRWVPWIKAKVVRHSQELLSVVAKRYEVSKRQANEYVNVLIASEEGLNDLLTLCQSTGLSDREVEKLFDKEK